MTSGRAAPKPWEEVYRLQGRLWRGVRLDDHTSRLVKEHPELLQRSWVDLACGDGKGLVPLAERVAAAGGRVLGVDLARQALRLCHEARGTLPGAVRRDLLQADMQALPIKHERADVVRAVHAVGHLPDAGRRRAWGEIARMLRPGGFVLAVEFLRDDARYGQGTEVEPHTFRRSVGVWTHYYELVELVAEMQAAGLEVAASHQDTHPVRWRGIAGERSRGVVVARTA